MYRWCWTAQPFPVCCTFSAVLKSPFAKRHAGPSQTSQQETEHKYRWCIHPTLLTKACGWPMRCEVVNILQSQRKTAFATDGRFSINPSRKVGNHQLYPRCCSWEAGVYWLSIHLKTNKRITHPHFTSDTESVLFFNGLHRVLHETTFSFVGFISSLSNVALCCIGWLFTTEAQICADI